MLEAILLKELLWKPAVAFSLDFVFYNYDTLSELKHHDACLCSQSLFPHLVCCSYLVQKLEIYSSKCIHVHNKLSFFSHLTRKDYITTQRNGLVEVGFEFEPLGMMVVGRSFSPFYSAKKKACISMLYLK